MTVKKEHESQKLPPDFSDLDAYWQGRAKALSDQAQEKGKDFVPPSWSDAFKELNEREAQRREAQQQDARANPPGWVTDLLPRNDPRRQAAIRKRFGHEE